MAEQIFPHLNCWVPFFCPAHGCITDNGWCWECAVEVYGYDKAKEVFGELRQGGGNSMIEKKTNKGCEIR